MNQDTTDLKSTAEAVQLERRVSEHCPDCKVAPGCEHEYGCDVERCPECGGQRLMCDCLTELPPLVWTGEWPGEKECREFGWFCRWVDGKGWQRCNKDDEGATGDLSRLNIEAIWDKTARRFVLPANAKLSRASSALNETADGKASA